MKIRKGFVTNSSSSSFILGFTSEENIKKELEAEDLKEYFDEVLEDVMRATKLTKDEVLEGYSKEIYYGTLWDLEYRLDVPYDKKFEIRETKEFQEMLQRRTGLEVVLWDERLTTMESERILQEGGVRRENRKERIDWMAATLILQSYMDAYPIPEK